jgi:hypothetical protein
MKYANTENYLKFSTAILLNHNLIIENLKFAGVQLDEKEMSIEIIYKNMNFY